MTPMNEAICCYDKQRPPRGWRKKVNNLLKQNASLWKSLGLHRPRVAFLNLDSKSIAVYISGTMNYPVIGIDITQHLELAAKNEINPVTGVEMSIVHEAGHAYLETCGVDTGDHDEDFVEEFARYYCDGCSPETARSILDNLAEKLGS